MAMGGLLEDDGRGSSREADDPPPPPPPGSVTGAALLLLKGSKVAEGAGEGSERVGDGRIEKALGSTLCFLRNDGFRAMAQYICDVDSKRVHI